MIQDARAHGNTPIDADLCIIGAGAAGITLANRFAGSGVNVLLLESGGPGIESDVEKLNAGASVTGHGYPLAASRLRFIGGATNHWSGHCYNFVDRDFAERPGIPETGWPIQMAMLAPYMPEAARLALFRQDDLDWSPEHWRQRLKTRGWRLDPELFETRMTFVAPINEATGNRTYARYTGPIERAGNVRLLHHANVLEIVGAPDNRSVSRLEVATLAGGRFPVRAKAYVLAAGGVENARIMLASRTPFAGGLGNVHDKVGRYFTDHVVVYQDMVRNPRHPVDATMDFRQVDKNTRLVSHFMLGDEALRREGLDDVFLRVTPVYDQLSTGADAARRVQDALAGGNLGKVRGADIATALSHPLEVGSWAADRAYCSAAPTRYRIAARLEPRPLADSRITLTDKRDALGVPAPNLHWTLADEGKRSLHRTLQLFAGEVGRLNAARVKLDFDPSAPWPDFPTLDVGYHHTGTTRMSADPKQGVVDRDCRVHGMGNMYVAGSSVFSTSGSGSPTMLITALALRLADHLKREHFA